MSRAKVQIFTTDLVDFSVKWPNFRGFRRAALKSLKGCRLPMVVLGIIFRDNFLENVKIFIDGTIAKIYFLSLYALEWLEPLTPNDWIEELGLLMKLLNFQVEIPTLKCSNFTIKVGFSSPLQGKTLESQNFPTT
jgi:hypothetical protein